MQQQWKPLLEQPGIVRETFDHEGIVEAFQTARFYIHTLNRNDSDLFGFGAMKAQACGAIPVLPSVHDNGFRDGVKIWIPYVEFLRGNTEPQSNPQWCTEAMSWKEIVRRYWIPMLEGKEVGHAA